MKKVLFLTRSYYPNIGGVEKHIWEISRILVNKGFLITIISEKSSVEKNNISKSISNINVLHIPSRKENSFKKYYIWKDLFEYIDIIREADIVHCHDVFFWYIPFRFIFPFKKIYITFHGYEGNNIPNIKSKLMHKIGEKLSHGNICVGNFLKKWYGTNPTYVIYGGVENKKKKLRKSLVTAGGAYIGRLEEEAGIMDYLKAIKTLKNNGINLKLDVFGSGNQLQEARSYVKKNKIDVKFKGFVLNVEKILPKYKFVFVSRYLGILEASAAGKQIFSVYNNEIKKDYLQMMPISKYFYIAKNSNQIFKQYLNYLYNPNLANIKVAQKWALKSTWESVVNYYLKLWGI